MNKLETHLEEMVRNFPNLIASELRWMPAGVMGQLNVCIQQPRLPPHGIPDLVFVTQKKIYLVELKKRIVNEATLHQLRGYIPPIKETYPDHEILGFLVGTDCPTRTAVEAQIGNDAIRIMLFGEEMPRRNNIMACPDCYAGMACDEPCRYCSD